LGVIRYAILNDVHFPYEGLAYHEAIKQISTWKNLAGIYLNGDILEIESLSRHPKGPQAVSSFKKEVAYANEKFDYLQKKIPDVPVTLVEGNHCYRLFRYIRDVAPAMFGLLEHPSLLDFDKRGWKFKPYGPRQWVKCGEADLWLRHEPLGNGQNAAKQTAERSLVDVLFGHTHTHQFYTHKKHGPEPKIVRAYAGGWLGDIKQSVFDYRGPRDNWVSGFNEVTCDPETGRYDYKFIYL